MLGLTAAVALGLIAIIANQGWPSLLGLPIPELPFEHGALHQARLVAGPRNPVAVGLWGRTGVGGSTGAEAGLRKSALGAPARADSPLRESRQGIAALRPPLGDGEHSQGPDPRAPAKTPSGTPPTSPTADPVVASSPSATVSPVESSRSRATSPGIPGHSGEGGHWQGGSSTSETDGVSSESPPSPTAGSADPGHSDESGHPAGPGQAESATPAPEQHASAGEHDQSGGH
jgi:hypothetical protein